MLAMAFANASVTRPKHLETPRIRTTDCYFQASQSNKTVQCFYLLNFVHFQSFCGSLNRHAPVRAQVTYFEELGGARNSSTALIHIIYATRCNGKSLGYLFRSHSWGCCGGVESCEPHYGGVQVFGTGERLAS